MLDKLNKRVVLLFFICTLSQYIFAQEESITKIDSLLTDLSGIESFQSKSHLDPDRAAILSAVLPGLGQIYNKQYWKLPILYGGAILIGHYIKYNNDFFNAFRNAYIAESDGIAETENPFGRFNQASLQRNAEQFKRDRDFLMIMGVVYYIINIVDAHVAAHLIEFDINSDLSFTPTYQGNTPFMTQNIGLSVVFKLNK